MRVRFELKTSVVLTPILNCMILSKNLNHLTALSFFNLIIPSLTGIGTSTSLSNHWRLSLKKLMKVIWYTLVYVIEFGLRSLWLKDKKTAISGGAGVELWPRKLATAKFKIDDMKTVKKAISNAVSFF